VSGRAAKPGHIEAGATHCTCGSIIFPHQMFPAPGVYEAAITLGVCSAPDATTSPLNVAVPALAVIDPAEMVTVLALMVNCADALKVMPLASNRAELPLLSMIST